MKSPLREFSVRNPDRGHETPGIADIRAKLMLVLLCLIWGITWPLMKVALVEIPPFSMRASSAACGALTLYLVCLVKRRSFRIPNAKAWAHVVIAALLNIVGFSLFSAFAQLATATSRVTILAYTMPIWSVLLAWLCLGERPTGTQAVALGLCGAGLAILIYPLTATGIPIGILLAIATGASWAAGTVYLKWARINADPMGVASWQLTIAFVVLAGCMLAFEGRLGLGALGAVHAKALFATAFVGVAGNGIAYGLWFEIVRRLPAAAASLGVLSVPVIGIIASVVILGEVPTSADVVGFALIFAASACVLLARHAPSLPSPACGGGKGGGATP
jgi:drug/metabolite transporter (DMT)-like permease